MNRVCVVCCRVVVLIWCRLWMCIVMLVVCRVLVLCLYSCWVNLVWLD